MFNINSAVHKPDIDYMITRVKSLMEDGIQLGDLSSLYNEFNGVKESLKEIIQNKYGIINPNSTQQIVKYMQSLENPEVYEVCCIDDKWTSKSEVLSELSTMGYEFADDILEYRVVKTYSQTIASLIEAQDSNRMIHPVVSVGKTNRINYSAPALMNIPKKLLWSVIRPRKEGNVLFSVDIKNQEPSILINVLGIDKLKSALLSENGLYETLFSKVFVQKTKATIYVSENEEPRIVGGVEMSESSAPPVYYTPIRPSVDSVYYNNEKVKVIEVCNSMTRIGVVPPLQDEVSIETVNGNVYKVPVVWGEIPKLNKKGIVQIEGELQGLEIRCEGVYRSEFKQSWNAMTYGASIMGIRHMCKHLDGDVVYKYFSAIPQFKEYKSKCTKAANAGIQTIGTFFGTPITANVYEASRLKRVLMDMPIQGTGADILSLLIKHFDEEVESRGLQGKLMLYYTRHDELILEADSVWVSETGVDNVIDIIRDIVEHRIDDWTPFKVQIKQIRQEDISKMIDTGDDLFE